MNEKNPNNETIKELLDKFFQTHYHGSFSRMACDYIHATGMTQEEVKELLEAMKKWAGQMMKSGVSDINSLSAKPDCRIPPILSFPKHHPEEHQSTYLL